MRECVARLGQGAAVLQHLVSLVDVAIFYVDEEPVNLGDRAGCSSTDDSGVRNVRVNHKQRELAAYNMNIESLTPECKIAVGPFKSL